MSTPICDFVRRYRDSDAARLHMPGHKGKPLLGFEPWDITEIDGADELFTSHGIIAESEAQASALFGAHTVYSTGVSTLCIQTMLHLTALHAASKGERPCILAARNAHKAFVNAAALLDIDIRWLYPEADSGYVSCPITPEQVRRTLEKSAQRPTAVYVTSPDYLGNMLDLRGIAAACHDLGVLLLVDNAHGAYLRFLEPSCHPLDLGADLCCDSAHKTLPVLTGGAYLHISRAASASLRESAKTAMAMFGSTSPSYLTLASLDLCNRYLADGYRDHLREMCGHLEEAQKALTAAGWQVEPSDPLRLTVRAPAGMTGGQLANRLRENGVECEYADLDFLVLMLTPENRAADIERLLHAFGTNDAVYAPQPSLPADSAS